MDKKKQLDKALFELAKELDVHSLVCGASIDGEGTLTTVVGCPHCILLDLVQGTSAFIKEAEKRGLLDSIKEADNGRLMVYKLHQIKNVCDEVTKLNEEMNQSKIGLH